MALLMPGNLKMELRWMEFTTGGMEQPPVHIKMRTENGRILMSSGNRILAVAKETAFEDHNTLVCDD